MSSDGDLDVAHRVADAADRISLHYASGGQLDVRTKDDGSPVTAGDLAVEREIRRLLGTLRPGDPVLGEELGGTVGGNGRRWVIDPIDGTRSYLRGDLHWATMVALMEGDTAVVGVVSAPALRRRWWATHAAGAWCSVDGGPPVACHAAETAVLADATVEYMELALADGARLDPGLAALIAGARSASGGTGFLSHLMVAQGVLDVALDNNDRLALWDVAALSVIVTEAGGCFGHLDGDRRPHHGAALSATAQLYPAVLDVLRAADGG